jgi:hypothetical protein
VRAGSLAIGAACYALAKELASWPGRQEHSPCVRRCLRKAKLPLGLFESASPRRLFDGNVVDVVDHPSAIAARLGPPDHANRGNRAQVLDQHLDHGELGQPDPLAQLVRQGPQEWEAVSGGDAQEDPYPNE